MIKKITALNTISVRNSVLRAGKNIESCLFEGDNLETTKHFGFFIDKKMVGVASIYENRNKLFKEFNQFQIRGMAILEDYQNKRFGEKLVLHCENYALLNQSNLIWFNARINAVAFYERLGYSKLGEAFEILEIGKHFVMFKSFSD